MRKALVLLALIACSLAAPRSLVLHSLLRDFDPPGSPHGHPDFETYSGNSRSAVASTLDQDGKPYLNAGTWPTFTSAAAFAQWYRDSDRSVSVANDLTFTETADGSGVFAFDSQIYFPLDGKGWPPGTYGTSGHNFHFTTEVHTVFTFLGNETFSFTGDDDLWVFINGRKAIDLGGVHGAANLAIDLGLAATQTLLGIVPGQDYTLDIFGAERHTSASTFKISTSLKLISTTPNATVTDVWICGVKIPNFGAGISASAVPLYPEFRYFNIDEILASFDNFNAIVFGNWNSNSGDTEGRFAVGGNVVVNGGYSVGQEIINQGTAALDNKLPYSVVIGGSWTQTSGSVKPDGQSAPSTKAKEDAFVAGNINGASAGLQARVTGRCASGSTCLNSDFANAKAWYQLASATLAAHADNAALEVKYGGGYITCASSTADAYYLTINGAVFNQFTYWADLSNSGCNRAASLVINIAGTGAINFGNVQGPLIWGVAADWNLLPNKPSGDNQNRLLWNVIGDGRTVNAGTVAPAGILLAPTSVLNHPGGVWKGIVIVGSVTASNQINRLVCPVHPLPPNPPPASHVCPYYETNCAGFGFNFPQKNTIVSFRDFNVVAFGSFYDHGGDVEGRLAVGGNADLDNFAVGLELHTLNGPDNSLPYSLVVAGNAVWGVGGGQVWPTGDANIDKWPGIREDIFVGGTFTAPQYLVERRTGQCQANQPGCLNTWFANAKQCYTDISTSFANQAANVDVTTQFSNGLLLTCQSNSATRYVANVNGADLNGITWYFLDNCNFHSEWVINVVGTGSVVITGGSFPAVAGGVVYNVVGSNRYVEVSSTALAGHLLAVNNNLNQTSSVIIGKVVVNNFLFANQVNKPCPSDLSTPITIPSVVANTPSKRQTTYDTFTATDVFIVGDVVKTDAGTTTIVEKHGSTYRVSPPLNSAPTPGSLVYTVVMDSTASRDGYIAPTPSTPVDSAASGISVFFGLVALLMALF